MKREAILLLVNNLVLRAPEKKLTLRQRKRAKEWLRKAKKEIKKYLLDEYQYEDTL